MSGPIPMPLQEHEVIRALEIARALAHAGVPLFLATANPYAKAGYDFPPGWENSTPDDSVVDRWRPGMALCAVGGHACDFLDVDPRNGGLASSEGLMKAGQWPTGYGTAATPSGGTHQLIQPLGVGKGEVIPGVDLQGGRPDGGGRGFVFIAPTVRASKVDGIQKPYRWLQEPDLTTLAAWRGADTSGRHIAALLPERKTKKPAAAADDDFYQTEIHTTISADRTIIGKAQEVTQHIQTRGWSGFRDTLNGAAYTLGAYVGSGYMTEDEATEHLIAAIRLAGYEVWDENLHTIAVGIRDGARHPIHVVVPGKELTGGTTTPGAGSSMLVDGETFLSEVPDDEPALWGTKDSCLWAPGESLMLVGPPGVGKSTLAHLLVFATLGLAEDVLGFPSVSAGRNVLYLAMDRPKQIARAMRRLRTEESRVVLKERLTVHKGPLPVSLTQDTEWILRQAQEVGASCVVVDSIKDLLPDLSDEKTGSLYNRVRQLCLAQGIEWIELHHNRKASAGNEEPKTLDDVYGSRWLTAGAGSVLSLWGQSGDAAVHLSQIKTPSGELFPRWVTIDKESGVMSVEHKPSIVHMLRNGGTSGMTARDAAMRLYETKSPTRSQKETARQKLDRLVRDSLAVKVELDGEVLYRSTDTFGATPTAAAAPVGEIPFVMPVEQDHAPI